MTTMVDTSQRDEYERTLRAATTLFSTKLAWLAPTLIGLLRPLHQLALDAKPLCYAPLTIYAITRWAIRHYRRAAVLLRTKEGSRRSEQHAVTAAAR